MIKLPWNNWIHTILYVILCLIVILTGQYVSQINGINHEFGNPPLYDIIHKYLPDMSDYYYVNTILVGIITLRFIFVTKVYSNNHDINNNWHYQIQNYIFIISSVLLIRAICLMLTSQPTCTPQCYDDGGSFPFNTCFDYLYSGHTVSITVAAVCIIYNNTRNIEKLLWIIYVPLSALWIAMSRQHYTVDVFLAVFIGVISSVEIKTIYLTSNGNI